MKRKKGGRARSVRSSIFEPQHFTDFELFDAGTFTSVLEPQAGVIVRSLVETDLFVTAGTDDTLVRHVLRVLVLLELQLSLLQGPSLSLAPGRNPGVARVLMRVWETDGLWAGTLSQG